MSMNELVCRIEKLNEWQSLILEAEAEAEALRNSLKAELTERGVEELEAGQYIIRYTSVLTQRFDTTGFKKAHSELYKSFIKHTTSKRFSIA